MNLHLLNPHIRYAKVHYHHSDTHSKRTVCYDCRFFFVEKGSGSIDINRKNYHITNNTAIYLPPGTAYRFAFDTTDIEIIVLDFDVTCDYAHLKESYGVATEETYVPDYVPKQTLPEALSEPIIGTLPRVYGYLTQCTDNFLQKGNFYREKSSALLKLCLLELIHQSVASTAYTDLCEQVLAYVHENYADAALNNSDISQKFNYHPYHLNRIFKQETGKTLHQYLIGYRVRVAKNLLLTTQNSIDQISWQCGFSSCAYFIKTFKDFTGETPKSYKKKHIHTEI